MKLKAIQVGNESQQQYMGAEEAKLHHSSFAKKIAKKSSARL